MDTMKAVRMHDYGGPEVLVYEDVPWPPLPREDQVLVRVAAAGVGPWDGEVRRGEWRGMIDYPLPLILGCDLSGTVAAIGPDAQGVRVGEEVYGVADMTLSGSNAAYALGHAANLAPKPRSLDHVRAAAVPIAAATALQMVRELARVAPGQTVLVLGATHNFVLLNPIARSLPTRAALAQATAALRMAFAR
jgi:NADPH:quinone reductase-like Zn-dependent oxidoreductase